MPRCSSISLFKPFGVLADAGLDLRGQLTLAHADLLQLVGEPGLQSLDVGRPVAESPLDGALHLGELLAQADARVALALDHVAAALLGDPALLFGEDTTATPRACR